MPADSNAIFSIIDLLALGLVIIGCIQGAFRGLSGELARLIGVIAAFWIARFSHPPVADWLDMHTRLSPESANLVAYAAVVIIALIALALIRKATEQLIKLVFEKGFDRAAGVIAGGLRMSLIACIIFIVLFLLPGPPPAFLENSFFANFLVRYVPTVEKTLNEAGVPTFNEPTSDSETKPHE